MLLAALATACAAQPATPTGIAIVRKPGHRDGVAQITVKGKRRNVTKHALQAWLVREGEGALVLVTHKHHTRLRYYDLDSGRRRDLGPVPFQHAAMHETNLSNHGWAFALSGTDAATHQPLILAGDTAAMPGLIPGASAPAFHGDALAFTTSAGQQSVPAGDLLGTSLHDIYTPPQDSPAAPQYLQVFPDGTAMTVTRDGVIHQGRWHSDGITLNLHTGASTFTVAQSALEKVEGVPAKTRLAVRLLQPLSSRTAKEGAVVHAISIEPLVVDSEIFLPEGSRIDGTITDARDVGWGFKHETAALTLLWNRATAPDGHTIPLDARIFEVENSQEKVTKKGAIQGIRSTGTPGHSGENAVLSLAGIDPIAYIFASAAGSGVLGFAEPEILYNSGTELILELQKPVLTSETYPFSIRPAAGSETQRQQLQAFVKTLPFRTRTKGSNKPSDITNLVFIGTPQALHRAFLAAGWQTSDALTAASTFRTLKTLSGNQTYTQAPMSVLLLDERAPLYNLVKTTNTFDARHHLRIFPTTAQIDGQPVLTASSTQDIAIAFSRRQKTFIHVIDEHIDNERAKIVNDLKFTGCVQSLDMVPRPWVPQDAFNSTGDRLITDGQAAVLHIGNCENPKTTPEIVPRPPNRLQRITRDTALTVRNTFWRGNLIYQGISGGIKARDYLRSSSELPPNYGSWRKTDASGTEYDEAGSAPTLRQRTFAPHDRLAEPDNLPTPVAVNHKWDPPRYELALEGGYLHFHNNELTYVDTILVSANPADPLFEIDLFDRVDDGWAAGGTVTINSWRHLSNEFSYFRQHGKYTLNLGVYMGQPDGTTINESVDFASARVGLVIRQFEYNLLAHLRPPTSRWRPYIAAGPAFQLIALSDAPLKKPAGPFRLGLKNIGLLQAAFDFGRTPPLDGGGIFQFGMQYGAGIKYRISPRVMLRADYRETWSKNPDIIRNSYEDYEIDFNGGDYTSDVFVIKPPAKFLQDRYTLGVAFTF